MVWPRHRSKGPPPRHPVRTALLSALVAFGTTGAGPPAADDADAPLFDLKVDLTQLRNDTGRVAVALFDSRDAFPDQRRALQGAVSKISGRRASVRFRGLRPGIYAIAVLHDENQNSKMDFNFLGMPLEGYGFSNDAPVTFGPPSFARAAFELKPRHSQVVIKVRYFGL